MDATPGARPYQQTPRTVSWRRAAGHLGRVALGIVFLAAGFLKGLDPAEFVHQVAAYGLIGMRLSGVAAPALIVLEIVLGVTLVAGVRPLLTGLASILLLLMFIGIEAYGIAAGRTEACGCFGAYVQRTPAQVIGEDLLFVGLAILAIAGLRGWAGTRPGRAAAVLVAAIVLSGAFVVASPSLPIDDYVTRLRAGRTLADLDLAARLPELLRGRHLIALIDVTDPRAAEIASALDALASRPGAPVVVGLTPATEQEIDAFRWTVVPAFEVKSVDRVVIKRLYRRLPRFFVLDSGRVMAVYDGAPPEAGDLLSSEAS
ncbi:MAG: hypothetical protein DMF52_03800 [Acidobacteria bacterium]|nr:MAG: hypothetical protein AUI52_06970 [Acidobacteria bacterium 13_1_40CM_2_68_10]PYT37289.1 MAG: hypothetical protein DMF52_03800 [Acidobacteriota bacterium]